MKICVVSTPVFRLTSTGTSGYSGLEHLAWLQAKGLAERGHQVALVAPDGSECPGVQVVHIGPEKQVSEEDAYKKYWSLLPQFEAVIDNSWQKFPYILKREGRLPAPVLGVCHAPVDTMFASPPKPVVKPCMVCISEDQATHFRNLFGMDCRVAYNGVCTQTYQPLGIPRSDRFLFLARFSSVKGPDIAIESCLKAGVGLDLIGDTSITNEPDLLRKCLAMADGKQIKVIGGATRGECVWWFSQAKALLHPNLRFREPLGLAPLEAQLCGCPVIAFDNGAMRETVDDGRTGLLVDTVEGFDAEVAEMHKRKDFPSDAMRQACREHAAKFSIERMVRRYEELCIEAVKTGGW